MIFSRRNKSKIKAGPAPTNSNVQSVPVYLQSILLTVAETWETPSPDQYDHARQGYIEHLQQPFLKLEKIRQIKTVLVTHKMERMIELAPDFFEKALSRSAFETGYFIERGKSDDEKNT